MINSKLVTILRTFSSKEMKEFEKLVQSPFFSTGRNLMPFLNTLKKYFPGFDNVNLSEENVFRKLYPGKKFNKTVIDKLRGDLTKLSIEFLRQSALKEFPLQSEILLSKIAIKKGLKDIAEKIITVCESELDSKKFSKNFYGRMELIHGSKQELIYMSDLKSFIHYETNKGDFILKKFIYLSSYSFMNFQHYRFFYGVDVDNISLMKFYKYLNLEKFVEKIKYSDNPEDIFLQINLYTILSWMHISNDEYFYKLKDLIFKNINLFDSDLGFSLLIILKYLIIVKTSRKNTGNFEEDVFEINNFALDKNCFILTEAKGFPKNEFVTYFMSGFDLGKHKWARNFVNEYSKYLSKEEFYDAVNYCNANLAFAECKFDLSLELLGKLNLKTDYEKVFTYYLKAAIYYEKKYFEELNSLLEAYFKFLKRDNKVRQDRIKLHFNFISCMRNLLKYQDQKDKQHIYKIEKILSAKENRTIMKNWLAEKLSSLS